MATNNSRLATATAAILDLFQSRDRQPDLVQAQVKALSKQIPLLFFITIVNTLAVAYTHYDVAPVYMTVWFSLFITVGYAWRGWDWVLMGRRSLSDADAAQLLKLTVILGPGCTAILTAWALALYRYGDAYAQGHVVFYLGITLISCIFCRCIFDPPLC